ncbi:MAG: imidazolonepropionase [Elusimicrobia bacterium]|nr:imidazolonepropionase [Elusimicrobiota bacterium]
MRRLILNAGQLLTMTGPDRPRCGREMSSLGMIRDGAVLVEDGTILAAGLRELVLKHEAASSARIVDAGGRVVLPGFIDSHSHPVFAGPRLDDFEGRIKGATYSELAERGGGILSTVNGVRGASEKRLADDLAALSQRFVECGTTTLEVKSGYGLDLETELKMLRAVRSAAAHVPLEMVPTFIGAHAVPPELVGRRDEYVRRVCEEMIPRVASESLARFADVFCEKGYFTVEDSGRVFEAAAKAGLGMKIHAEQLSHSGGAALAVKGKASSADHLDCIEQADVEALAAGGTVACLVPGSNYFLGKPYPPARRLIDGGAAVALATDFNPGTCPCWDMRMILSIACTQMKMTPAEALLAVTVNGAHALGLGKTHGSLEPGKKADILCYDARDYREIPYFFGSTGALWVMKNGVIVHHREDIEL